MPTTPSNPRPSGAVLGPLRWVKPPLQARSRKTLEKLLDAAEELIRESGATGLTVSEVVRRAGSSVGAFYARFPDKDGLFATLQQRSCDEAVATAELALDPARWESVDLGAAITEIVRFLVNISRERRGLIVAFIGLAAADVAYADRRARVEVEIANRVLTFFRARLGEFSHSDPERAAIVTVRTLVSTLEYGAVIFRGEPNAVTLSDETLAEELARVVIAYLGIPGSGGRPKRANE